MGQAQNQNDAARLIFPQKTPSRAADDQSGPLVTVSLHVDTGAVAGISLHIDLAAPHGVSGGVPDAAVDDDPPRVHRVADGVLGVSADLDAGAVQISAQRISGDSGDLQMPLLCARADESLSETSGDHQIFRAVPDLLI